MNFICQAEAIDNLKHLAKHNQHGVLIVGDSGSGKTYLARYYSQLLRIPDFHIINPVIADLKTMIDSCVTAGSPVAICIENLDDGVTQASYPLLKVIEDCPSYMYIIVTCNNLFSIPDTIPSRCALVSINPPTRSDIEQYSIAKDTTAYEFLKDKKVWKCIKSFGDADIVLKFTPENLKYFDNLDNLNFTKNAVSNLAWTLQHYEDKTETPLSLVIRYLMQSISPNYHKACIECLNDLADNRISKNAIVSKLVFELKYTK